MRRLQLTFAGLALVCLAWARSSAAQTEPCTKKEVPYSAVTECIGGFEYCGTVPNGVNCCKLEAQAMNWRACETGGNQKEKSKSKKFYSLIPASCQADACLEGEAFTDSEKYEWDCRVEDCEEPI